MLSGFAHSAHRVVGAVSGDSDTSENGAGESGDAEGSADADDAADGDDPDSDLNPYKDDAYEDAAKAPAVTSISIPATVETIDLAFFQLFPNAARIAVADANPVFASQNGMLFDADLTSLHLVPEGMEGNAVLPDSLATVPAYVFSRCNKLTAISFTGSTNATFATRNAILYTNDLTTLLAAPAGLGSTASIAPECAAIAEGAFWGNAALETIVVNSSVGTIEADAFLDEVVPRVTVALTGEYSRAAWEAVGFTRFTEPAQPGAEAVAESGLAYTLLDDYTLSVRWAGDAAPEGYLEIPARADLSGIAYPVSTIAEGAFEGASALTQVVLPETIATIGARAFAGTGLAYAYIPANVTAIGDAAFQDCAQMRSINLNSALATIGDYAFAGCGQVEFFVLPATVEHIGAYALADNEALKNIVALGTVADIDPAALVGVSGANIYVPYAESGEYAWGMGAPVANNHLMPYGVKASDAPLELAVDESANLFEGGWLEAPGDIQVNYSYKAKPMSIDADGTVTGKAEGASTIEVELTLSLGEAEAVSQVQPEGEGEGAMSVLRAVRSVGAGTSLSMTLGADTAAAQVSAAAAPAAQADESIDYTRAQPLDTVGNTGNAYWAVRDNTLYIWCENNGVIAKSNFAGWSDWQAMANNALPQTKAWWEPNLRNTIQHIKMDSSVRVEGQDQNNGSMSYWFGGLRNLQSTDGVIVPVGVTTIEMMFYSCPSVKEIGDFRLSNQVKSTYAMFGLCSRLSAIPDDFKIPTATTRVDFMFQDTGIVEIPEGFTVPSGATTAGIFKGCNSLEYIPASYKLNSVQGTSTDGIGDFLVHNGPKDTYYTGSLQDLNPKWETSVITDDDVKNFWLTKWNRNLIPYDAGGKLDTVRYNEDGSLVTNEDGSVKYFEEASWSVRDGVLDVRCLDSGAYIAAKNFEGWKDWRAMVNNTLPETKAWWNPEVRDSIQHIKMDSSVRVEGQDQNDGSMAYWFGGLKNLQSTDGVLVPTGVIDVEMLFYYCAKVNDLGNFRLSSAVKRAYATFGLCSSLTSIPDDFYIPATMTSVEFMFQDTAITAIPEGFAVPSGCLTGGIFKACNNLEYIPASYKLNDSIGTSGAGIGDFLYGGSGVKDTYYTGSLQDLNPKWETSVITDDDVKNFWLTKWNRNLIPYDAGGKLDTVRYNEDGSLVTNEDGSVKYFEEASWSVRDGVLDVRCLDSGAYIAAKNFEGWRDWRALVNNTLPETKAWWNPEVRDSIQHIKMDSSVRVEGQDQNDGSMAYWFGGLKNLQSTDGVLVPTGVIDIDFIFYACSSVQDIGDFRLGSAVKTAYASFGICSKLESIPSDFQLPATLTTIEFMFQDTAITVIPDGFAAPAGCLTGGVFKRCPNLEYIPASYKLNNVIGTSTVEIGDFWYQDAAAPKDTYYTGSLQDLNPKWETSVITDDDVKNFWLTKWNRNLIPYDAGGKLDTVRYNEDGSLVTNEDGSVKYFEEASWSVRDGVLDIRCLNSDAYIADINFSSWDHWEYFVNNTLPETKAWWQPDVRNSIQYIKMDRSVKVQGQNANQGSMQYWFAGLRNLQSTDGIFVPTGTINVNFLFYYCPNVRNMGDFRLSSAVQNAQALFGLCSNLENIPSDFRLPTGLKDAAFMFQNTSITAIPDGFSVPEGCISSGIFANNNKLDYIPASYRLDNTNGMTATLGDLIFSGSGIKDTYYAGNLQDLNPKWEASVVTDDDVRAFWLNKWKRNLIKLNEQSVKFLVPENVINPSSTTGGWAIHGIRQADSAGHIEEPEISDNYYKGFSFVGWYSDEACTWPWFQGTVTTSQQTVYGKFAPYICSVNFADGTAKLPLGNTVHDGTMPDSAQTQQGTTVSQPSKTPTMDGYTFDYWYYEDAGTAWDFTRDTVPGDMTLKAHWTPIEYTVTFKYGVAALDAADSSATKEAKVTINDVAVFPQPASVTNRGKTLEKWQHGSIIDSIFNTEIEVGEGADLHNWTYSVRDLFNAGKLSNTAQTIEFSASWVDSTYDVNVYAYADESVFDSSTRGKLVTDKVNLSTLGGSLKNGAGTDLNGYAATAWAFDASIDPNAAAAGTMKATGEYTIDQLLTFVTGNATADVPLVDGKRTIDLYAIWQPQYGTAVPFDTASPKEATFSVDFAYDAGDVKAQENVFFTSNTRQDLNIKAYSTATTTSGKKPAEIIFGAGRLDDVALTYKTKASSTDEPDAGAAFNSFCIDGGSAPSVMPVPVGSIAASKAGETTYLYGDLWLSYENADFSEALKEAAGETKTWDSIADITWTLEGVEGTLRQYLFTSAADATAEPLKTHE